MVKKFLWYLLILNFLGTGGGFFFIIVSLKYFSPSIWSCKNSSKFPPKSPRNEIERICKEASKLFESLTKHKIHKSGAEKEKENTKDLKIQSEMDFQT